MPRTVLSCLMVEARQALAWWVHSLATRALLQHLRFVDDGEEVSSAPQDLAAIQAAVDDARQAILLVGKLRTFTGNCRQRLPLLAPQNPAGSYLLAAKAAGQQAAQPKGSLLQELQALEGRLLCRMAAAVFPAGKHREAVLACPCVCLLGCWLHRCYNCGS